jgi:UDP-N-acetylmuramoyl-tripeptide--D-alanyl-D-alanine ligase
VARAKSEALQALPPRDGVALFNGDDPVLRTIARMHRGASRLFGVGPHAELRGERVERTADGMAVEVLGVRIEVPGLAPAHAHNVIAAVAVGLELGVPLGLAARRLRGYQGAPHRLVVGRCGPLTLIDDCYNANPVSVRAALDELASRDGGRRVVVLGEMRELGNHAVRCHREVGAMMRERGIDVVVGVGPLTRDTLSAARPPVAHHFDDTDAACTAVPAMLQPGDVVLVKASRAWRFERVVQAIRATFADAPVTLRREPAPTVLAGVPA